MILLDYSQTVIGSFMAMGRGKPVVEEDIKHRSLDDIKPGGLGTYFIQQIMDEVVFKEATGWHNNLVLTKQY